MVNTNSITANQYFERVFSEAGTQRSKTAFLNVKAACDALTDMKAELNYAQVGKYATTHTDGPKTQSIRNSDKLKTYIALRMSEYDDSRKSNKSSSKKPTPSFLQYPASDLDLKTKAYIDQLRQELEIVNRENKNLSKMLTEETRKNPISLAAIQDTDNKVDAYLAIDATPTSAQVSDELKATLGKVIRIDLLDTRFEYEERNGIKMLMHKSPSGDSVFLDVADLAAIEGLLRDG